MGAAAGIALLGLVLTAVGAVLDVSPLYVPGVAFALLGVLVVAWVAAAARGVTVSCELAARRLVEGEPVRVRLEVRSRAVPLPVATVHDPLLDAPVRLRLGARAQSLQALARLPRRGRVRLDPPVVALRDPLELARRTAHGRDGRELIVLPRIEPLAHGGGAGGRGRGSAAAALLVAAPIELDGLRPYREGSPATRIHWPALARGRGLVERRLRAERDAWPLVVLDSRGAASREDLDAAVRAAASLAYALARAGGVTLLLPGERRARAIGADLAAWAAAHERLALVDGGEGPPRVPSAELTGGTLVYVAARRIERLPRGLRGGAHGGATLVVPGELPGRAARFAVAGCRGYAADGRARRVGAQEGAGAA